MLQEILKAAFEILLLGALYFALLTSIRGTRGAGILKGTVFFIVIAFLGLLWLANFAGLDRIKLLLQYVLAGSVVAVIIIFAPEMRRGLLRLAQAPFLAPLIHGPSHKVIDEVTSAAVKLSKNRIGALIAIEREVGLGDIIENGQRLDATLSSELLESIFYPGNPLHDGAVVIQHEQIAAAACLFPLPEDTTLSRTMGTRHRAAIGISEETDAIAIVVSEETGRISVCVGGKMTGDLTRDSLEKALRELYARTGKPTLGLRWGRKPPPPEPEVPGGAPMAAVEPPPLPPAAPAEIAADTETRKRKKGESKTRIDGDKEKRTA
jgi:diadenylate cyclase